jgi:hypothetical protein
MHVGSLCHLVMQATCCGCVLHGLYQLAARQRAAAQLCTCTVGGTLWWDVQLACRFCSEQLCAGIPQLSWKVLVDVCQVLWSHSLWAPAWLLVWLGVVLVKSLLAHCGLNTCYRLLGSNHAAANQALIINSPISRHMR